MRILFALIILFSVSLLSGQSTVVYDSTGAEYYFYDNQELTDNQGNTRYTVQGNIVFEGSSTNKRDILLLARVQDLFGKKLDYVFDEDLKKEIYAVEKGQMFLKGTNADLAYRAIIIQKADEERYLIKHGQSEELLYELNGPDISTGLLVAVAHQAIIDFKIEESLAAYIRDYERASQDLSATSGTIRRLWNSGTQEFVWDGEVVTPKWTPNDFLHWRFDGYTLERLWYGDADAFEWDGRVLRRKWYTSQEEFEVIGNTIRPRYGQFGDEYLIQGNIVKNPWDPGGGDEWQISGDVPIPIIILVVYGLIAK